MVRAAIEVVVMAEKERSRTPLSVRIPDDLAKRLDRLVPKMHKHATFSTIGRVSRSSVVKLALLRGVEQLEAEFK